MEGKSGHTPKVEKIPQSLNEVVRHGVGLQYVMNMYILKSQPAIWVSWTMLLHQDTDLNIISYKFGWFI